MGKTLSVNVKEVALLMGFDRRMLRRILGCKK
jgi:hypothetical protein